MKCGRTFALIDLLNSPDGRTVGMPIVIGRLRTERPAKIGILPAGRMRERYGEKTSEMDNTIY